MARRSESGALGRARGGQQAHQPLIALFTNMPGTPSSTPSAVGANQKASEIALAHGVGLATVRAQIQSVRNKFGVSSIDALLLQVAALPPITTAVH